jgi:hypothetical protein
MRGRRDDRPTLPPTFDVAQYAKDSDAKIRAARVTLDEAEAAAPETAQSETRLLTRPRMGAVPDETWARSMPGALVVLPSAEELKRLPLDHRAGFLLAMMDGSIDLDTLVEIAGMPREEALRLVRDLFDSGIIEFR